MTLQCLGAWLCSTGIFICIYLTEAAQINISMLTVGQMTVCKVNRVTHTDKPSENYHLTLQFPSFLWSISASSSPTTSAFCFILAALILVVSGSRLFSPKKIFNASYTTCPASNAHKVSNLVEH